LTNPVVRPKLEIKTTEGSVIFDFGLTTGFVKEPKVIHQCRQIY